MSTTAPSPAHVWRIIERRSFCTLATSSAAGEPHVAGVLYAAADRELYLTTQSHSKKARNLRDNPRVAVCIPVRTYPVGPPFCVQFRGTAELLSPRSPDIVALLRTRQLKKITSHGELDDPDSCFVRLVPDRRISTYGIGVPLRTLLRDPMSGSRSIDMGASAVIPPRHPHRREHGPLVGVEVRTPRPSSVAALGGTGCGPVVMLRGSHSLSMASTACGVSA